MSEENFGLLLSQRKVSIMSVRYFSSLPNGQEKMASSSENDATARGGGSFLAGKKPV